MGVGLIVFWVSEAVLHLYILVLHVLVPTIDLFG
jgi:hypothetical protein